MGDCTLVCAWSAEEAARYIETIKANPYILICVLYILNLEPLEHWTINNVSSTLNLRPYTKF